MEKKMLTLLVATMLAGCAMGPDYQRPASPVPQQVGEAVQPVAVEPLQWERYFTDPALAPLIRDALANNRDLQLAVARVDEARGLYGVQRADQLPNVDANVSGSSARYPAGINGVQRAETVHAYSANLGLLAYEVDFWGRVRRLTEAARAEYLATDAAQKSFRSGLIADVVSAYYAAQALSEQLDFSRKTEKAREETLRLVQRRVDVGVAGKLDRLEAQTSLEGAQTVSAQLAKQTANARHALSLLVGRFVSDDELASGALLENRPLPIDTPEGVSSDVLLARPDVLAAEQRLVAASANIGAARAAFFPRVTLIGSAGTASTELDALFKSGTGTWVFSPSISLPIFDAGRNQSNLDVADARKIAAVAIYEKSIQTAFKEVADVLSDQRWLEAQLETQQRLVQHQAERMGVAEMRYKDGLTGYLEFLIAQRDYFASQQTLIEARRARLTVAAQAYKALGGE